MPVASPYLAHTRSHSGHEDPLAVHLRQVAGLASRFAAVFGAEQEARIAGVLHDLGKYGALFQARLRGEQQGIDHWSAGAWVALQKYQLKGAAPALAIHGHHVGLGKADVGALRAMEPARVSELQPDLRASETDVQKLLAALERDGLTLPEPPDSPVWDPQRAGTAADMLDVRMLYSALVDADFLATEAHFGAPSSEEEYRRPEGLPLAPKAALAALLAHIERVSAGSDSAAHVNKLRADLLAACLSAAEDTPGLFTLTAPTGSGKTLSMLAFALKHAALHGLRRIVCVIPYLSIIDQTVGVYREALAALGDTSFLQIYVLEDHSLADTRGRGRKGDDEQQNQARLLAENWDAPIVVTTSVQALESLFANRSRPCRKLHRLARSVLLFDEVQTLPTPLAVSTLATLARLSERYGATVLFSTATQPAFSHLHDAVSKHCALGWQPREIAGPGLKLFERARRTRVQWPAEPDMTTSWGQIADDLLKRKQALVIVNLKRHALTLLDILEQRGLTRETGLAHLSTNMCPAHRQAVLTRVRERLGRGERCLLVSTQCVEAGVDVDFPVVYRAWGPLEAIAQAAGRCNRNGNLTEPGEVCVFVPQAEDERRRYPDAAYEQAASVLAVIYRRDGAGALDIDAPECFADYYAELFSIRRPESLNRELMDAICEQNFETVAREYRVIDTDAVSILVPYCYRAYEALAEEARAKGLTGDWVRRARANSIGVFRPRQGDLIRDWLEPVCAGRRREPVDDWFIYLREDHYDSLKGLVPPDQTEALIA